MSAQLAAPDGSGVKSGAVLSLHQARDLLKRQGKRSKFNAVPVMVDGIRFDSKHEAKRYQELILLEKAGVISELKRQVPYPLHTPAGPLMVRTNGTGKKTRQAVLRMDFTYVENGERIAEDAKGFCTALARHKIAHVESEYGITVRLTRATGK